jgi:hypothetical protein
MSVVLIQYSEALSYTGLGIVFGFTGLSAIKLRREIQQHTNSTRYDSFNRLNDNHVSESERRVKKEGV